MFPVKLVSAMLLVIGLLAAPGAVSAQSPVPPIRVGYTISEAFMQGVFAQEAGLFRRAGLNVDNQLFSIGPVIVTAVASGNLDVGVAAIITIATAVERGLPFVIIAPAAMTTPKSPAGLMCVAKSSPVNSAKELEGKTIALAGLRQLGDLSTRSWLTKGGVDLAKVQFLEVPFAEMGAGLERGTFAAANISDPALSLALERNQVRCIGDPFVAIAPAYPVAAWFTTKDYAQKNPELVRRLGRVLTEAGRWANTHHDETATIISNVAKIDVDTIRGGNRKIFGEQLRANEFQPPIDAALKFGFLSKPVSIADFILR